MQDKKTSVLYKIIRWIVSVVYPKTHIVGAENIPEEASIAVGNHSQIHGPIAGELYFPGKHYIWTIGQMMTLKEVPAYAFQDFWSEKPKWIRWFFKIASYIIAPVAVFIFRNAHCIPVYHDSRILSTFRETVQKINEGNHIVIYPECYDEHNQIVHEFQHGFVDVARIYYKKTGKKLSFVPMYLAPSLRTIYFGKPTQFDPDRSIEEERIRICNYLMDSITEIAVHLPRHRVVPYPNIPKKDHGYNIPAEEATEK